MAFPVTARYFLRFRHTDTNLPVTFSYFKRSDTLADLAAPSINELANGTYYFDWTFSSKSDPDIVFEADGTDAIPTHEVRYIADTISPKDYFLDQPISQVVEDVWNDSTARAAGTKGKLVENIGTPTLGATLAADHVAMNTTFNTLNTNVGTPTDSVSASTLFGRVKNSLNVISNTLGTPITAGGVCGDIADAKLLINSLSDTLGTPIAGSISGDLLTITNKVGNPVRDSLADDIAAIQTGVTAITTGNIATTTDVTNAVNSIKGGSSGPTLQDIKTTLGSPSLSQVSLALALADLRSVVGSIRVATDFLYTIGSGRWKIDHDQKTLTFYDGNGAVVKVYDLKDEAGQASAERIYEKIPRT